jgi:hypothetical protein
MASIAQSACSFASPSRTPPCTTTKHALKKNGKRGKKGKKKKKKKEKGGGAIILEQ